MRKLITTLSLVFVCSLCIAQKEDHVWIMGSNAPPDSVYSTSVMDFNSDPVNIELKYKFVGFYLTDASICDSAGNLVCYTNGVNMYGPDDEIIENGEEFQPSASYPIGFPFIQGGLILPSPGHPDEFSFVFGKRFGYYNAQGQTRTGYSPLTYSKIQSQAGTLAVAEKHAPISNDTLLSGQLTAVRHGNGRDWWVVTVNIDDNRYSKFLLDPQGVHFDSYQAIGDTIPYALGQVAFSPNGNWYARYTASGVIGIQTFSDFYLMQFDRCTGEFSDPLHKHFSGEGTPGGVAFSPDSRYLYVSKWDKIYQYDLQAADILSSETLVAEYDGFLDERGLPTRFFLMQLAPDNRIYINISNLNSRYLHVINQPNLPGASCEVLQHEIMLPTYNVYTMPNLPYFRLYQEQGSLCDTIATAVAEELSHKGNVLVYPNPAVDLLHLRLEGFFISEGAFIIYDVLGRNIKEIKILETKNEIEVDISNVPTGIYFYELRSRNLKVKDGVLIIK